jgi:hypothetical protein
LGYFWRFEIPGFVIRFLPNIDENLLPSSFIRQNARNRALSAPKSRRVAKSMPGFFRNFKLPDFHRFHAAGHTTPPLMFISPEWRLVRVIFGVNFIHSDSAEKPLVASLCA